MRLLLSSLAFLAMVGPQLGWAAVYPYQGRLDQDGNPQNGDFDMRFELYDSATDGTCLPTPTSECLWHEELAAVPVTSGNFSVSLGETVTIADDLWLNDPIYLAIAVRRTGETDYTALQGRQKIANVPRATHARAAGNYHIAGTLTVGNGATISNGITVNSGDIRNTAADAQLGISQNFAFRDTGDAWLHLRNGVGSSTPASLKVNNLAAKGVLDAGFTTTVCHQDTPSIKNAGECYCSSGSFPLGYVPSCNGSGHGLWGASYVKSDDDKYGIGAWCWHSNGSILNIKYLTLLCARIDKSTIALP